MGFFNASSSKPVSIQHDFFGGMLFHEHKNDPGKSYFAGRRHFNPSNKIISLGINGRIAGPTENQIDFFKSIEDNYATIAKAITPLIENLFRTRKPNFTIRNFQREFDPVYLHIPSCESSPVVWEIAFDSDHDKNHTFTLTMHDFEAQEVLVDG